MINYTGNYNKFCMSMKQSRAVRNEYHLQGSEKNVQENRPEMGEIHGQFMLHSMKLRDLHK